MKVFFKKNNLFWFFGFIFLFTVIFLFSLFQLNPLIDTGREFYLPLRVLNGEVLYRDIFNIYGPLAYQINAFAYKIPGANINALRIFGSLNSTLIMIAIFFILREFFTENNKENSALTLFLWTCPLFLGIFYTGTFNYTVPYAFAMTYGLCFFLFSLLFFIKFVKSKISVFAFFAAFFAGCAVACKYEFIPFFIFLLLYLAFSLKNNKKIFLLSVIFSLMIPLLSFGTLFVQGMTFEDLIKTSKIIKTMTQTEAIKYFYRNYTGMYFNFKIFGYCLLKTVLLGILTVLLYFANKFYRNDKILFTSTLIFVILGIAYAGFGVFSLFGILHFTLFLCFIKKIFQNKPLFIFMTSVILFSMKNFFALNYDVYGTYILPFIIISSGIFVYTFDFSDDENKKQLIKAVFTEGILLSLLFMAGYKAIIGVYIKKSGKIIVESVNNQDNYLEKIQKTVYVYPNVAKVMKKTIDFINENTSPDDTIVVLPESQFLNFVTKRPADNIYDSITPLYLETFGEDNIIFHFKETRPKYFILNNRDTSDYGKKYICEDYGQNLCKFIKKDYEKIREIEDNKYRLQIYRRTD